MHCPNDGATLQMTSREGIEIDYCPECRGVWLDRGELDKLIECGSQPIAQAHRRDDDRRHESHHYDNEHHKKHKKESFLGDMFDF
jgi:Zn-finger nucleic acid-binding protein